MIIPKSWGHEDIIHSGGYCMKLLVYEKPIRSSLHYHNGKHECFYVASGRFEIEIDRNPAKLALEGDRFVLPPGTIHRIRCLTPGIIVEASDYDLATDCVRIEPSDA